MESTPDLDQGSPKRLRKEDSPSDPTNKECKFPTSVAVGVDVECGSDRVGALPSQIGYCAVTSDGVELFCLSHPIKVNWGPYASLERLMEDASFPMISEYLDVSPGCVSDFWLKKMPKGSWERIQERAMSPKGQFTAFWRDIQYLRSKYTKVSIVTDNAAYDIAKLNAGLEKYVPDSYPLWFSTPKDYTGIVDICRFKYLPGFAEVKKDVSERFPHDHDPSHDARHIVNLYMGAQRILASQK